MGLPARHEPPAHPRRDRALAALTLVAGACTTADPVYVAAVPPAVNTAELGAGEAPLLVLTVPIRVEDAEQAAARAQLAAELGLAVADVPSVRRDDVDVEIEWSIRSLDDEEVVAKLAVFGANELYRYDPTAFADPEDDDAAAAPPLMGGKPIIVPAGATVTGVFREDEIAEASQDLDAFTRAGVNPGFALLTRSKARDVTGAEGGALARIPSRAVAQLLRFELTVGATGPVILAAELRVRDRSDRLDPNATDPASLVPPSTTVFMAAAMMPP